MSSVKEFAARHRFARITARKARYVADLIRGRSVNEALELLQFTPNRGAPFYLKVLRSAIATASQDEDVNINRLVISDCRADDGPLLQGRMRWRAGPQGRAMPFAKRLSHLTLKVRAEIDAAAPARRPAAEGSAPAHPASGERVSKGSKGEAAGRKTRAGQAARPTKAGAAKAAGAKAPHAGKKPRAHKKSEEKA